MQYPTEGRSVLKTSEKTRLQTAREAAGLSRFGLARRSDVHISVVENAEKGGRTNWVCAEKLADGLELPLEDLFDIELLTKQGNPGNNGGCNGSEPIVEVLPPSCPDCHVQLPASGVCCD